MSGTAAHDASPADGARTAVPSLRDQAIAGGAQIVGRQVVGLALRSVGLLVLTRLIGPGSYGTYAAALAVVTLIASLCRFGSDVYLIRLREENVDAAEEQVFSFLIVTSIAVVGIGVPVLAAAAQIVDIDGSSVLLLLVALAPVNVLWVPAQARLERELRYRELARIELGGDLVLYGVAVTAAASGAGVWAPVCGYGAWQLWLLLASYAASGFRPRWRWDRAQLHPVLRYGSTYSTSHLAARLQDLANPLVVGGSLGAVGVGHVALTLRLVDNLGFVRRAVNQMAVPTLVRVLDDRDRLARAHQEAMVIKVLGLGVPLVVAAIAMPIALPLLVGDDWTGVSEVFPLLAAATLLAGPFTLHGKVLNIIGRNLVVAAVQGAAVVVLLILGALLVPRLGLAGFGWASIGAVAPMLLLDRAVRPTLTPSYGPALRWTSALVPLVLSPLVPAPAVVACVLPAAVVLARSDSRQELRALAVTANRLRHRPS